MTTPYPPAVLKVEPHAIPVVRRSIKVFLDKLSPLIDRLGREGYIEQPWLGDSESWRMTDLYNTTVMTAADGPYQALVAYREQLVAIHGELQRTEDNYRRTEGDHAALWGQKA